MKRNWYWLDTFWATATAISVMALISIMIWEKVNAQTSDKWGTPETVSPVVNTIMELNAIQPKSETDTESSWHLERPSKLPSKRAGLSEVQMELTMISGTFKVTFEGIDIGTTILPASPAVKPKLTKLYIPYKDDYLLALSISDSAKRELLIMLFGETP